MPASPSRNLAPSVTVIVLNYNGQRHLQPCLTSLEALDYPRCTLMVADNGSSDGSIDYVGKHHPRVRIVPMHANLGFALAYNRAVAQADTEYVALLNNDTRVSPSWLTELVEAAERNRSAAAAAAIVDWDGTRIDFVGGLPTAIGHSWQVDYGEPVGRDYPERRLLFGCGGALLVRRDAFGEAGGFDEDFFAYFEDVDLGWRMNLLGHATVFAPRATTFHRLHGTFGGVSRPLRLRLYERNALAMIYKNYGDESLARVLPVAVALTLGRNLEQARLDGQSIRFGFTEPRSVPLPSPVVATLLALEDFARWLPALREKRQRIQEARQVSDEAIFALMPHPFKLHDLGDRYRDAAEALIRDFRVAELVGLPAPPARIAVAARPLVESGEGRMAGGPPGPRVSVVVLTASGATYLPDCLDSLRQQTWPGDRTEIIVIDNGSVMDPTAVAEAICPGVRVLRTGRNLGFSAGNNAGARVATGDYVAFLNDDTKVVPTWLEEMVAVAERQQAACVGSVMLDWSGTRVDFAGGLVNFEGRGFSSHYDEPVGSMSLVEQPVLFACGGAALFRRDVFESAGAWDEPTFAYYEDVEFGWRLWLLGHEVWLAPRAVVYHKHHGTSASGHAARLRAFERNGLRMIYALLEEDRLQRVLPAALLMAVDRALLATPFSRAAEDDELHSGVALPSLQSLSGPLRHALIQRGARKSLGVAGSLRKIGLTGLAGAMRDTVRDVRAGLRKGGGRSRYLIERPGARASLEGRRERVPTPTAAALLGIQDFLHMLPELSVRRASLQARRKRSDAEILARFGDRWTDAVPSARPDLHAALRDQVMAALRLADEEPPRRPGSSSDGSGPAQSSVPRAKSGRAAS
jgi:GT2 family glycosyltransferase